MSNVHWYFAYGSNKFWNKKMETRQVGKKKTKQNCSSVYALWAGFGQMVYCSKLLPKPFIKQF